MTEYFQWRDEWMLYIHEVDDDHKELVAMLNEVAKIYGYVPMTAALLPEGQYNCKQHPESEAVVSALKRLGKHVRDHFEREEAFMRAIDYPDYQEHISEHALLLAEFTELLRKLCQQGVECLDRDTLSDLKHWLIGHMVTSDRDFADYYYGLCGLLRPRVSRVSHSGQDQT